MHEQTTAGIALRPSKRLPSQLFTKQCGLRVYIPHLTPLVAFSITQCSGRKATLVNSTLVNGTRCHSLFFHRKSLVRGYNRRTASHGASYTTDTEEYSSMSVGLHLLVGLHTKRLWCNGTRSHSLSFHRKNFVHGTSRLTAIHGAYISYS